MEAMNYGIPCIVSANDAMPEIVDDRVNGIVIERLTPECLAHHIINLLNDTSVLTKMSKEARQKIKNRLNWNDIAKNISQILLTKI
jgi:glycosyltransferase involved in cell wall biosynthesis